MRKMLHLNTGESSFFLFFFVFFFCLFVCLFFVFLSASGPLLLQDTWYVLFPVTLEAYAF